ncbi:MAG: DNA-binding domain-containing protein, AraC-type [bacterium P3]|nr:MAG: DNA-binding domain-containing protein, AraC-type [bacterium P3]KWW39052.1 MAG: DNA-binding domain-containing protein, AraC-type [bacterium F083]
MKKIKQFNLSQLNAFLNGNNRFIDTDLSQNDREQMASDYISEHLLVVRNPPVNRLLSRLTGDTLVIPEMRVLILTQGSVNPVVNLTQRHYEAGQLVFMSHNSIVQPMDSSDDLRGFGLSLTDEIAGLAFPAGMPKLFDGHVRDCNFMLTTEEMQQVEDIHSLLYNLMHDRQSAPQVVLSLAAAFLWQVDSLWSRHESETLGSLSREQRIFTDFIQLVSCYATQEHNIDFYARRLFLSPRYMSTLVKQVSGKAAKQWIDDAIVTRIKVELRHTDKSAAQIADEMNFPNPSFFCKYFKRMTGTTTQAYRAG